MTELAELKLGVWYWIDGKGPMRLKSLPGQGVEHGDPRWNCLVMETPHGYNYFPSGEQIGRRQTQADLDQYRANCAERQIDIPPMTTRSKTDMSTRCTVHFSHGTTDAAIVYRHYDGYPDEDAGMLHTLASFFAAVQAQTNDWRFNDPSYLAAKYVVWQANEYKDRQPLDFLGVGIVLTDPRDIEYRYTVDCDQLDVGGYPTVTVASPA